MSENATIIPDTPCPRQLFDIDLQLEIQSKLDQGHNLIIQGGFNSNYEDLHKWMLELGLNDIIAKKYGKGPTTYNRSSESPIDHIFGTSIFTITNGCFWLMENYLVTTVDYR